MVHRNRRPDDLAYGKYNGLGGKLEPDEDVCTGMRREIQEESGLRCDELRLRGTISWPGVGAGGEPWFSFIFTVPRWSGTPYTANDEGELHWVGVEELIGGALPLWAGDRHFLPLALRGDRQFHGVMPYEDGRVLDWSYTLL